MSPVAPCPASPKTLFCGIFLSINGKEEAVPIKWIVKIVVALNSNTRPGEVGAGTAFGFLLAFLQGSWALRVLALTLTFFLKINNAALLLSLLLFIPVAALASPLMDLLGGFILTLPALQGLFTRLYNMPLLPFTRFNNTLVMGGLATGIFLWPAVFFGGKALVVLYRTRVRDRIADHWAVKWFTRLPGVSTIIRLVGKAMGLSRQL